MRRCGAAGLINRLVVDFACLHAKLGEVSQNFMWPVPKLDRDKKGKAGIII
jgi:hypothetical protein